MFTHKLSHDEQLALSEAEFDQYCRWLFAVNERICRQRENPQPEPPERHTRLEEGHYGNMTVQLEVYDDEFGL